MTNKIKTIYNRQFYAPTPTTSMRKLPLIAEAISKLKISEIVDPFNYRTVESTIEALLRLHSPEYVNQFLTGNGSLASSQGWKWTKQIRDGVLAMNTGMLVGADFALENNVAGCIYQGAHHAKHESGGGFCTFNGLSLIAQEFPDKKIMILDCDEHQGDGTMDFIHRLPNLYNYSIYGTEMDGAVRDGIERHRDVQLHRPRFDEYRDALMVALAMAHSLWKPDLIVYQAGVDCHVNDPFSTINLTTEQLFKRDLLVFEFCRDFQIPLLFVMAGGYGQETVNLHVNTFKAAHEKYQLPANPKNWKIEAIEYIATLKA